MTRKDLDATLRQFRRPPVMTMDEALASENPVAEIVVRLGDDRSQMTAPERMLWEVTYFLADTDNGGLAQSLGNESGELVASVVRFTEQYGPSELARLLDELAMMFPSRVVPRDHAERAAAVASLPKDELAELTDRVYALRPEIEAALLRFVQEQKESFHLRAGNR